MNEAATLTLSVSAVHAAALWSGLNLLVMLVLSGLVVQQRRKWRIPHGDGGVPELAQALRAFGNAAEYTPAIIASLAVMAVMGPPTWMLHVTGGALLIGRIAHAFGLSTSLGVSIGRSVGMILTWIAWLIAAFTLIFFSF